MQTKHGDASVKFNETFPPAVVDKWERMVAEWDADKSKKNPYEEPVAGVVLPRSRPMFFEKTGL